MGSQILAKDIPLPEGSTLQLDPEALVVNVIAAPSIEEVEAELAEAEAEVGIERDESDESIAATAEAAAAAETEETEATPDAE